MAKKAVKKIIKKTAKKAVKRVAKKPVKECVCACKEVEGKLIGKITHYFSNIEVAVILLSAPLKTGDKIRIIGGQETDFEQEIASMQIDHKEVNSGKKGDSVGVKIGEKVHEGYKVYKI